MSVHVDEKAENKKPCGFYASFRRNVSTNYGADVIAQIKAYEDWLEQELLNMYDLTDPMELDVELDADVLKEWANNNAEAKLRECLKDAKKAPSDMFIRECLARAKSLPDVDTHLKGVE
mmetsp:Transcript_52887/g.129147  ORF Transcript_52887/g.129147 Transcript_52887/m.129147 type:complete len:119 (-) Transcript_52887:323-679(-)